MSNFPADVKYTNDHEWVKINGDEATIGITDYAQGELGDIVFIDIETVGDTVPQGDVFGTVEAVKTVSDLFMPVTGEILELNSKLEGEPELVNKDPYGEGWMIRIKMTNNEEVKSLLSVDDYKKLIGQ